MLKGPLRTSFIVGLTIRTSGRGQTITHSFANIIKHSLLSVLQLVIESMYFIRCNSAEIPLPSKDFRYFYRHSIHSWIHLEGF